METEDIFEEPAVVLELTEDELETIRQGLVQLSIEAYFPPRNDEIAEKLQAVYRKINEATT